mmetsp:Transcript_21975/g.33349  ORF Transcript_21975/g.33349 Transcript_21975/m.33349 type:complete len:89 (+) Transcript_21975:1101-1367(+)
MRISREPSMRSPMKCGANDVSGFKKIRTKTAQRVEKAWPDKEQCWKEFRRTMLISDANMVQSEEIAQAIRAWRKQFVEKRAKDYAENL